MITASAWAILGNPRVGAINTFWRWLTGTHGTIVNVYSFGGVVWHMVQHTTRSSSFSSSTHFADGFRRLRKSSNVRCLALADILAHHACADAPVTQSAFILSFMHGIEAFTVPAFFGTPINLQVLVTEIYRAININAVPDYQYATALASTVMAFLFLLVIVQWRLLGGRSFYTVPAKVIRRGHQARALAVGDVLGLCSFLFPRRGVALWAACRGLVLPLHRLLSVGHADSGALQESIQQQRCLACVSKHHVSRRHRLNRDHDPRRHCRLCVGAHTVARAAPPRYVGVAALDDAGHGPGGRSSLGLCDHPRAGADLRHDLGVFLAYLTLGTPLSVRIMAGAYAQLSFELGGIVPCPRGELVADIVAYSGRTIWPAFAVGWTLSFFGIMRELSASVLLFSIGNEVLSVVMLSLLVAKSPGRGHGDRTDDHVSGVLVPMGAAHLDQTADNHAVTWAHGDCHAKHPA